MGSTTAIWLVPVTIQVFAAETAIRALRNPSFSPRGKKNIPICLAAILVLIGITWAPSRVYPAEDSCVASLLFYIRSKGKAGVVTILCISVVIIISLVIIIVQLSRNVKVRKDERIAASRIVYYLVITAVILVRPKMDRLPLSD
jgi:NADH:ubiquinone oxidoreductase subunit 5 (subunit L)/multisubunit Na+/H+ antiporter MnhA subunit